MLSLQQLKRVLCKLGLKRRVSRYSVRHLQVEEQIRVGCSKIFCSSSYRFYSDEDLDVLVCCRRSFMDQEYSLVVGQCVTDYKTEAWNACGKVSQQCVRLSSDQ